MEASAGPASERHAFSSADFRGAVGAFATGVTVITTHGEADVYGMTANAFSSVSLDPPLVLVCVISGTAGAETIERNGAFAVNILGAHQEPISRFFSSRERPAGRKAFETVPHFTAVTGCRLSRLPARRRSRVRRPSDLHRRGCRARRGRGGAAAALPRRRLLGSRRALVLRSKIAAHRDKEAF